MNSSEMYVTSVLFQNKILGSDASAFEALFSRVLSYAHDDFIQIKPYGREGDKKNDGFIPSVGTYYQVYAPEDLRVNESNAISKLKTDFEGLKKHWDHFCNIKKFYFVLNDKYKGVPPNLQTEILKLNAQENNIEICSFTARNLDNIFFDLPEDKRVSVIGPTAQSFEIKDLNFSILTEVVNNLLNIDKKITKASRLSGIEFDEKIKFNNLSSQVASYLTVASFFEGDLNEFFRNNADFKQDLLKEKIVGFYEVAKEIAEEVNTDNDLIFFNMLESITQDVLNDKRNVKTVQDCVIALISHYFESCDIFESISMEELS